MIDTNDPADFIDSAPIENDHLTDIQLQIASTLNQTDTIDSSLLSCAGLWKLINNLPDK